MDNDILALERKYLLRYHILSGRIGKVVASNAAVAHLVPPEVALIYAMHEALREYCK